MHRGFPQRVDASLPSPRPDGRPTRPPTRRRPLAVAVVLSTVAVMAGAAPVALAAKPSTGTLVAPGARGASASTSWTGTISPGAWQPAGNGLRCFPSTAKNATNTDVFQLKLLGASPAYYLTHSAKLTITVTYTPAVSAALNELALTTAVDDGSGNDSSILDGAQSLTGSTTVSTTYTNPLETTGKSFIFVGVCAGRNVSPQDYTATAKITVGPPIHNYPGIFDTSVAFQTTRLPGPPATSTPLATSRYGEPTIWINKNGRGIITTFGPTVWTTTDNGATWSQPFDLGNNNEAGSSCPAGYDADSDGIVGPDNTFYADNLCVAPVPSGSNPLPGPGSDNDSYTNTSDGVPGKNGANWKGPTFAGGDVDRQWYAADPKKAGLVYMSYHDLEGPNINLLKSTDGGATFTCPELGATFPSCPVTATQNGNNPNSDYISTGLGNTTGRPLIDPTNTSRIYVPYLDNTATSSATASPTASDPGLTRVHMAVSTDGGTTWSANTDPSGKPILDADAAFPYDGKSDNVLAHLFNTAAIDSKGNLYVLFSLRLGHKADVDGTQFSGTTTHLYLISSQDKGLTWSKPVQVDHGGINSNVFQWIVAGDPGRVAITWYGSKADDFNDPTGQWSEMYAVSTDALSAHPTFTQVNVSGLYPMHNGDICQAGIDCQVTGGNRDLADFQMVTIDSCGRAHAVWTDDTGTGETRTAIQTSGPLLTATDPCAGSQSGTHSTLPTTSGSSSGTLGLNSSAATSLPNTGSALPGGALPAGGTLAGLTVLLAGARRRRRRRAQE